MRKTAIVTGASRGSGKAIALELAEHSYDLIITCKERKENLQSVNKQILKKGVRCYTFTGDLQRPETAEDLFSYMNTRSVESIDVLVNNAGISYIGLLQTMTYEEWNRVIQTNLTSIFSLCKCVIPYMLKQKSGKIINISSVWGQSGASCEAAYSAAKGGLDSFTRALAKELAPGNIQVNAIACGAIETEMNAFLNEEEKMLIIDSIPSGRFGRPDEVAKMVSLLCQAPDYLTGQIISLDGGGL